MIADTFESLRPKLTIYSTAEEAFSAAEELEKEYQEKIGKSFSHSLNCKGGMNMLPRFVNRPG